MYESRAERRARKLAARGATTSRAPWWWLAAIVIVAGSAGWWFMSRPAPSDASTATKKADELRRIVLSCTTDMATTFHIHSHLTILVDGTERPIPTDTGITNDCLHPLHTHDGTGVIHVEAPVKRDFTLGNFFTVWDEAYTLTQLLDVNLDSTKQLKLFADGQEISTGPETVLRDRTSYVLMVGAAGTTLTPPANYTFSQEL
ncbi:MAG: hypothetical protein HY975_01110 [Candidatus Kerfeldbacteria bacterium]|nr:hypothetical protein [Candidatus Kerfeldbacteria bacterium]